MKNNHCNISWHFLFFLQHKLNRLLSPLAPFLDARLGGQSSVSEARVFFSPVSTSVSCSSAFLEVVQYWCVVPISPESPLLQLVNCMTSLLRQPRSQPLVHELTSAAFFSSLVLVALEQP